MNVVGRGHRVFIAGRGSMTTSNAVGRVHSSSRQTRGCEVDKIRTGNKKKR